MKFHSQENVALPALSWCMQIAPGLQELLVTHGVGLHIGNDFFAEGCWSGGLRGPDLLDASICAASGAVIKDERLFLVTPTNTVARLYTLRLDDCLWVSNSMALVAAAAGQALQQDYLFYQEDLSSIVEGLDKAKQRIPLEDGKWLELHYHCNLYVASNLTITRLEKKESLPFSSFASYEKFLHGALEVLLANAKSSGRSKFYTPVSSISRGYDSVACSVLAKNCGCRDAISFFDPDAADPHADDGSELAERLGLQVHSFSRTAYREEQLEYEFLAAGTGGEDAFFAPLESFLRGRVFITGFHGDKVWDRLNSKTSPQIVRGDPSGADLEEFRLRVGFIHAPIPFFGCRAHQDIYEISNARDMQPWSVAGDYDRPICRRIGEEAGLPRESFGRTKRVMSRAFSGQKKMAWYFGEASLQEFRSYAAGHPQEQQFVYEVGHWLHSAIETAAQRAGQLSYRAATAFSRLAKPLNRFACPLDESKQIFNWSFSKLSNQYAAALQGTRSH